MVNCIAAAFFPVSDHLLLYARQPIMGYPGRSVQRLEAAVWRRWPSLAFPGPVPGGRHIGAVATSGAS